MRLTLLKSEAVRYTQGLALLALVLFLLPGCRTAAVTHAAGQEVVQSSSIGPVQHGAVAADHAAASRAGIEMLQQRGNAVDAAVATSFCLSVVRPFSCGLGGGGFMVIYDPQQGMQVAVNYRERAPGVVNETYYTKLDDLALDDSALDDSAYPQPARFGPHAVAVPGTVAGLLHVLDQYGSLDRQTVLGPAINAAERGFFADQRYVDAAAVLVERLNDHPTLRRNARYTLEQLCRNGAVSVGDRITNPRQAAALRLIARDGAGAFYDGPIGDAIVQVMDELDGPLSREDLHQYATRTSEPLVGGFGSATLLTMPPPSSGGIAMQQIFGIVERRLDSNQRTITSGRAEYIHLLTEAMKHAFADRARWLADDAFVDVPVQRLISDAYLDERAAAIDHSRVLPTKAYGTTSPPGDDSGTSHISVIDHNGMAVACTETINLEWGSLVEVPGYGFMLNNEMDDFTTVPGQRNAFGLQQSDRNLPQPGKQPLSSMSPTIVVDRNGDAVLIAGGSGGPRIISATVQCLLNCLLFDDLPAEAVGRPRFHHQWLPPVLQFEEGRWAMGDTALREDLTDRGHDIRSRDYIGVVQLIRVLPEGIYAATDPRKGGEPAGY